MAVRMRRAEQAEVVGQELLAAALDEFLAHGFHGATLDRIAAAAGYTKGVVYSRYQSKADLFLALLEQRIEARRAQNDRLARGLSGPEGVARLAERWSQIQRDDQGWTLLVVEFRVHAARNPELQARYAELHRRTLDGVAEILGQVLGGPAGRNRRVAQVLLTLGTGATIEQAVDPKASPPATVRRLVHAILEAEAV